MKKNVTMADVAASCGLSRATVSRVLNRDKTVRAETCRKVYAAIERLEYHPNSLAKALSGGSTNNIAVVIPDVWKNQPYYINLIEAIEDVADSRGYHVILKRKKNMDSVYELASEKMISGAIIRNTQDCARERALFSKMDKVGIPFILIGQAYKSYPFIKVDNVGGGRTLALYFAEQNFRKVLIITGPSGHIDSIDRTAGFRMGFDEKGFDLDSIIIKEGDFSKDSGYRIASEVLPEISVDAIFAQSDRAALGVMLYCREAGIKIPEDLSLAGYDDNFFAKYLTPSLTTLQAPMFEIGTLAMEMLVRMIEDQKQPFARIILPPRLVARESTLNKSL